MNLAEMANIIVCDIRTYSILSYNNNYRERLFEAYEAIKGANITSFSEFRTAKLGIGAFSYGEITIFDRIKDEEYKEVLSRALRVINNGREAYIENEHIGDDLASWGTLGYTPKREELIKQGYISSGLTPEETDRHM